MINLFNGYLTALILRVANYTIIIRILTLIVLINIFIIKISSVYQQISFLSTLLVDSFWVFSAPIILVKIRKITANNIVHTNYDLKVISMEYYYEDPRFLLFNLNSGSVSQL